LNRFARLAVRTRCGDEQGWGNFFRLTWVTRALIERFSIDKSNIDFYVETKKHNIDFIRDFDFQFVFLEPGLKSEQEEQLLANKQYDLCLIELMYCDLDVQLIYKKNSDMVVVFDDLVDSVYSADVVISGQSFDGSSFYTAGDCQTRFYMGYEYFLLNPAFKKYKTYSHRRNKNKPEKLLVAIGDDQYLPAHLKILDALRHFPQLEINYLVKTKADSSYFYKRISREKNRTTFTHIQSTKDITGLLEEADFAIVSGGYTKLEAAITNTPAIVLPTQYHQVKLAKKYAEVTGLPVLKHMSEVVEADIVSSLDKMITNYSSICSNARDYFGLSGLFDGYDNFLEILNNWNN